MDDYRLVAARRLAWNEEAWREPALIYLALAGLKNIAIDETQPREVHAEVEFLIRKLHTAAKPPCL